MLIGSDDVVIKEIKMKDEKDSIKTLEGLEHSYLVDIYHYWKQFNGLVAIRVNKKLLAIKNRHFDNLHAEHFERFFCR